MAIQAWSIGLQKHTKMNENHVHIRYTDHFKQVGMHEKKDRKKTGKAPCSHGIPCGHCTLDQRRN